MMANFMVFLGGLVFAVGLGISGMTQPTKVIGFLNILGNWDPSLMMVMAGAVTVYFLSYLLITRRAGPVYAQSFALPTRKDIDRPLVFGAMLFGIGWGMVGFCPGPALVTTITGNSYVLTFVMSMTVGMYAYEVLNLRYSSEPDGGASLLRR